MKSLVGSIAIFISIILGFYAWMLFGGMVLMGNVNGHITYEPLSIAWIIMHLFMALPIMSAICMFFAGINSFRSPISASNMFITGAIINLIFAGTLYLGSGQIMRIEYIVLSINLIFALPLKLVYGRKSLTLTS